MYTGVSWLPDKQPEVFDHRELEMESKKKWYCYSTNLIIDQHVFHLGNLTKNPLL